MTAPPAAVDGHTAPPDPAAEAVTPAMPPIAPREEDPDRLKKNLARSCTADESGGKAAPPATGVTATAASETTGGCEATAPTPSWVSRLASDLSPPPASGQKSQVIARLTASGHADVLAGRGTRTLTARPVAGNRPQLVTPRAVTA